MTKTEEEVLDKIGRGKGNIEINFLEQTYYLSKELSEVDKKILKQIILKSKILSLLIYILPFVCLGTLIWLFAISVV